MVRFAVMGTGGAQDELRTFVWRRPSSGSRFTILPSLKTFVPTTTTTLETQFCERGNPRRRGIDF